jgi:tetratricopeptide (TPR) repeat protein
MISNVFFGFSQSSQITANDAYDALYKEENYDKAIWMYDVVIKDNPDCVDCYIRRGYAHQQKDNLTKAVYDYVTSFKKANDQNDKLYALQYIGGSPLYDYTTCLELTSKYLETNKNNYEFKRKKIEYLVELERYKEASDVLKELFKDDSYDLSLNLELADLYFKSQQYFESVQTYNKIKNKVLALDASNPRFNKFYILKRVGDAKFELNDYRGAIDEYKIALDYSDKSWNHYSEIHNSIGDSYYEYKQYESALFILINLLN